MTKERINITIDPWLLSSVDVQCVNLNYNRSQFISRCITYFIKNHDEEGARGAARERGGAPCAHTKGGDVL